MEELAKNQCSQSNLLERADRNAEKLLSVMIRSEEKYKDYRITFNYYEDENTEVIKEQN